MCQLLQRTPPPAAGANGIADASSSLLAQGQTALSQATGTKNLAGQCSAGCFDTSLFLQVGWLALRGSALAGRDDVRAQHCLQWLGRSLAEGCPGRRPALPDSSRPRPVRRALDCSWRRARAARHMCRLPNLFHCHPAAPQVAEGRNPCICGRDALQPFANKGQDIWRALVVALIGLLLMFVGGTWTLLSLAWAASKTSTERDAYDRTDANTLSASSFAAGTGAAYAKRY